VDDEGFASNPYTPTPRPTIATPNATLLIAAEVFAWIRAGPLAVARGLLLRERCRGQGDREGDECGDRVAHCQTLLSICATPVLARPASAPTEVTGTSHARASV